MTSVPDLSWIDGCDPELLEEAEIVLAELCAAYDVEGPGVVRVSRWLPLPGYKAPQVGGSDPYGELRAKTLRMLHRRGVVKGYEADGSSWVRVDADEAVVRRVRRAIQDPGAEREEMAAKDAKDAKDALKVSKRTLVLVIETAVHALSHDTIDRVMGTIHREDEYRGFLRSATNRIGERTDEAVGEAINYTLIGEGRHESFYLAFTTEVLKSVFRTRARSGRYGRDEFRREFHGLARLLDSENLAVAEDGELGRPGAAQEPDVDTAWVDGFDRNVLDAARDILGEIKVRLDMDLAATSVTISGHWRKDGGMLPHPIDQLNDKRNRLNLLRTLQQRKAIISFSGDGRGIEVEASRRAVDLTIQAITDLFEGRRPAPLAAPAPARPSAPSVPSPRESLPRNQQDALPNPIVRPSAPAKPSPSPANPRPLEEFGREYGKGVAGELGKRTGTLIAVAILLAVLTVFGIAQDWWGKATRWLRVQAQTAQSDTTHAK